ncbi:MAG: LysR substrate-binding domain-containing protein [Halofilum sp. (in: g-proteobacteria)]
MDRHISRLPSLSGLSTFDALVRWGSVKRAAHALAVTPQAVSQQVKQLEYQLNVALITYEGRQWRLTAAGQASSATLRAGFDYLQLAVRQMREAAERPRLAVSVDPALASTWLVPRMADFDADAAGFDVWLDASIRWADLAAGEADIALRYGTGDYPGLRASRLFDDRVFPVCSPALRDGVRPLRTPADLAAHALIHLDWQPARGRWPGWRDWLDAAGAGEVQADRGMRFTDHALALQAAAAGQGVALASAPLTRDSLAAGLLVRPFERELDTGFGYDLLARSDEVAGPAMVFADWIRRQALDDAAPAVN